MMTLVEKLFDAAENLHDKEVKKLIISAAHVIDNLTQERDYYRQHVVWGHYEEEKPSFHQGIEGEHEINEPINAKWVTNLVKAIDIYKVERDRFKHAYPEITGAYFLSGGYGDTDTNELPQYVQICPAYGCSWSQVYERTDRAVGK
jgi:hypothetical protein